MKTENTIEKRMVLIADSHHGIYIPQLVLKGEIDNPKWNFSDCNKEDIDAVLKGPENEWYWDAWNNIESNVKITDSEGTVYFLYQNDDLWAIPEECADEIEEYFGC